MRPLTAQLFPARHQIGPTAWSLLEPSKLVYRLSFLKVKAVHELCSEPRVPTTTAAQRPLRRPGGRGLQGREPIVGAQVAAVVSVVEAQGPPTPPPVVTGGARAGFWPKKGVAIAHTRAILWTKISGRTLLFCEMSPRATAIAGAITSQGAFLPLGPNHRKAQYNTLRAGALRKPGLHGRRAAVLMQMVQ